MDGRKQQRGALDLVRAAEAVLPRQRKAAATKEFKTASLELRRRQKKERGRRLDLGPCKRLEMPASRMFVG
jgi:hypothetical protein